MWARHFMFAQPPSILIKYWLEKRAQVKKAANQMCVLFNLMSGMCWERERKKEENYTYRISSSILINLNRKKQQFIVYGYRLSSITSLSILFLFFEQKNDCMSSLFFLNLHWLYIPSETINSIFSSFTHIHILPSSPCREPLFPCDDKRGVAQMWLNTFLYIQRLCVDST